MVYTTWSVSSSRIKTWWGEALCPVHTAHAKISCVSCQDPFLEYMAGRCDTYGCQSVVMWWGKSFQLRLVSKLDLKSNNPSFNAIFAFNNVLGIQWILVSTPSKYLTLPYHSCIYLTRQSSQYSKCTHSSHLLKHLACKLRKASLIITLNAWNCTAQQTAY
jgi:hypothetical protein